VTAYLRGGPWDPVELFGQSSEEGADGANQALQPAGAVSSTSSLPAVRVAVLGAPRVGKTRAAKYIADELKLSVADTTGPAKTEGEPSLDSPAWLGVTEGTWPATANARAQVHVWDAAAAPLPGLLGRLLDSSAPLLAVAIVDSSFVGAGSPADRLLEAVSREVSLKGPRRAVIVENDFTGSPSQGTPASRGRCRSIRCNLTTDEGSAEFRKAVVSALGELVSELEALASSSPPPPPVPAPAQKAANGSDQKGLALSSVVMPKPWLPSRGTLTSRGVDRSLASCLAGDTVLLNPTIVSWAWAATRAAQGGLAEGAQGLDATSHSCSAYLVPWDRLERVLATATAAAGGGVNGDSAAAATSPSKLLRALADLSLVCPIPAPIVNGSGAHLGCMSVLVPDFARRSRLAFSTSNRVSTLTNGSVADDCDADESNISELHRTGGNAKETTPPATSPLATSTPTPQEPISARFVWDAPGTAPPQLRTLLRDFLAQGTLGSTATGGPPRFVEVRRFALLEAGPANATGDADNPDSLSPGFLLVFDLVAEPSLGRSVTPKPPPSALAKSPSGGNFADNPMTLPEDELIEDPASRFTAVIVGASNTAIGKSSSAPFWDVYCSGPHAHWAWRTLLGSGASGIGFSAFRRVVAKGNSNTSTAVSDVPTPWPLPPPVCVASTSASSGQPGGLMDETTGTEFVSLSWLFNGPQAATARSALLPQSAQDSLPGGGFAKCCAALCGKENSAQISSGLEEDGEILGLVSFADFEASLLARRWRSAPRFLEEALAGSVEVWALCATALARFAHDAAGAVAGARGRALPLLYDLGDKGHGSGGGRSKVVAVVPDGGQPLVVGPEPPAPQAALGPARPSHGLQAWLRICRPAALWSAAGGARGFTASSAELPVASSSDSAGARTGAQVVEALQAALAIHLTEAMVFEVWDALRDLEVEQSLTRRPGGGWARVDAASCGFLL